MKSRKSDNSLQLSRRFITPALLAILLPGLLLQPGCTHQFGSAMVEPARFNYNEAIHSSLREQMLLNLLRLRFGDSPYFLGVGTVVTQYSFDVRLGSSGSVSEAGSYMVGGSGGVGYSETPTISYKPLSDGEFAERILRPISPNILVLLSHSGWRLEPLLQLSVQRINRLPNLPIGDVNHLLDIDRYQPFVEVTGLFRELQAGDAIGQRVAAEPKAIDYVLTFERSNNPDIQKKIQRAKQLLDLDPDLDSFPFIPATGELKPGQIHVEMRSLLGVMQFLARGIVLPAKEGAWADKSAIDKELDRDYSKLFGHFFEVHSSDQRPSAEDASVAVRYRGRWYYIADHDLASKRTFATLLYLFSVQAIDSDKSGDLLLTLPAG